MNDKLILSILIGFVTFVILYPSLTAIFDELEKVPQPEEVRKKVTQVSNQAKICLLNILMPGFETILLIVLTCLSLLSRGSSF